MRADGRDWPFSAETMIGRRRLDNLIECLTTVLDDGIPGDLIETGVWRGGATILMRGALAAWEDEARSVWVADSFRGLPTPDGTTWPADQGVDLSDIDALAVPRSVVEANFERYGLLDERVHFLEGWFADTLPTAPIKQLALLRLDGDLYQSTWEALEHLYPKLSVGGIVIVDPWPTTENGTTSTTKSFLWTGPGSGGGEPDERADRKPPFKRGRVPNLLPPVG